MRIGKVILFWFAVVLSSQIIAQDQYHQQLLDFLRDDYQIEDAGFIFYETEQEIIGQLTSYGDATVNVQQVQNFSFTIISDYDVKSGGGNAWDAGINLRNVTTINQGDIVLITFWARQVSESSEIKVFAEDATTFAKEIYLPINLTPDWTQYFVAYKSSADYEANSSTLGFHIATQVQQFQLGGFTAFNLGQRTLEEVPSTISASKYGGYQPDAPWRMVATQRIEELRKKNLTVRMINSEGVPLEGVEVDVEMQSHDFGFGSAVVGCRFPGNRCEDSRYVEKLLDLDGKGHGFNVAVTENALKWDGWEEQWIGTPEETVSAIEWLNARKIEVRGHTLIWPGWNHLPEDMEQNKNDISYLRSRINARIEDMVTHPVLSQVIREWDVLNEITQVRDLEMAFKADPAFTTGREIYPEILSKVMELQPEFQNYINDYVVLSGGGAGTSVINRYKSYLDEIVASGAKFDGIGFQCHIGTQPTSILKVEETLDDFYARYGKRMKITEYDINENVDEETQARYLADFLTMIFSHPGVDAFLMWGFWDGNHWKNNAPMFNLDWTLKPSGEAFINKVFKEWWTDTSGQTHSDGNYTVRVFKGVHKITIRHSGEIFDTIISTEDLDTLVLNMVTTSNRDFLAPKEFLLAPNPVSGKSIFVQSLNLPEEIDLEIYSQDGKHLETIKSIITNSEIPIELSAGVYYIRIISRKQVQVSKVIVL